MKIIVPATSANIGPGFDSVGVAVSKYLTIEVLEERDEWLIEHDLNPRIPKDKRNLLIKVALQLAPNLQPYRLKMTSDIPLARGLGSSSSVIVAGIELANQLGKLDLTDDEKLDWANKIEGHPDNVAPAIFGNLVISDFPECSFIAYVPKYELKTRDSRSVLPFKFSYKEAVAASSIANVAIAALLKGDLVKAGRAIESDRFHERFRQKLVREFPNIKKLAKKHGAYATYLSGAGPTIMILAPKDRAKLIQTRIEGCKYNGEVFILDVDRDGVRVEF